jgi:hypothetical protein
LPFVSHTCGTWVLTLREELLLRGFKNRVLKKKDLGLGERKYTVSGDLVKKNEMGEDKMKTYKQDISGKNYRGGERETVKPRWKYNTKLDFNDSTRCAVDSCGSGQGQTVDCCKHCNEPSRSIKCGELLD